MADTNLSENSFEDPETLEVLEYLEDVEPGVEDLPDPAAPPRLDVEAHPLLKPLLKTFENFNFPAVVLSPKLYILWENSEYQSIFSQPERKLPISLAQDFPHTLDTEGLGSLYTALNDPNYNHSYRVRLEAIHHKRLTRVFNVNITPIYLSDSIPPLYYQAFFDDVTREQKLLIHNTFLSLLEASKLKDNDTGKHIQRVGGYSRILGEALLQREIETTITPEFIENIQFLAQMHDVGKIGTPDDILNKEGSLDEREWEIMREHTINGAYIMSTYPHPMAREIALFHHEHWDGNGYPYQLAGDMIPVSARIVAVADVYDALRMVRSYKTSFTHEKSVEIITGQKDSHFDPNLIEVFQEVHLKFESLYEELKDS